MNVIDSCVVSECKSWVYKSSTKECFLKNAYVPKENTIKCDDCTAYDASSYRYIVQTGYTTYSIETTTWTVTFTPKVTSWTQSSFGTGGGWKETTGSTKETCTFAVGFDQPAEYNLKDSPFVVDAAFKCCNECNDNDGVLVATQCHVLSCSMQSASHGCGFKMDLSVG